MGKIKAVKKGLKKVKDEMFPPVGKRIGDGVKDRSRENLGAPIFPKAEKAKTAAKLIESPKVKLAKKAAKVAGAASAGAAAATAYEGGGARMRRMRQQGK